MKTTVSRRAPFSHIEPLELRIAPATIFVSNTNDSGVGSLRQAIADANGTPAADTILFKPSAFGVIVLTSGDLDITTPMKITGPGAGKVILNGNNTNRIFNISDGNPSTLAPVSLSGLALVNGNTAGAGGAISCLEPLTLTKCLISGNTSGDDGGGVLVQTAGKFVMSGCTVSGNSADDGGGLYLEVKGGISILNSTISGNTATSEKGGGAYLSLNDTTSTTAKIIIQNTTIVGNTAATNGGGLYLNPDQRSVSVVNCTISGNTAGVNGGGIFMRNGTLAVQGGVVSGNTADSGGGIFMRVGAGKTNVIKGVKIFNNSASVTGGGGVVFDGLFDDTAALNITASTISGNSAATNGGGIFASTGGKLGLSGGSVSGNSALGNHGGGVFTTGAGGSAVVLSVTGGTFAENVANASGGGIGAFGDGVVTVKGAKFLGNHAGSAGGGAYLRSPDTVTVTSTLFSKNSAKASGGGVAFVGGTNILTGATVTDNVAGGDGGGIYLFGASTITKSLIRNNAAGNNGGGIVSIGAATIASSILTGNFAKVAGGGIFNSAGSVTLGAGAKVVGNVAPVSADKNF